MFEVAEMDASSRPFTGAGGLDQETLNHVNKVFDKWLRCMYSQESGKIATPFERREGKGWKPSPSIKEINWSIQMSFGEVLKDKPLQLDKLTDTSIHQPEPYKHLQMLVVN